MKISNRTKSILKNFSTINSGIKIETGKQIKTISHMKNILAVAGVDEEFPVTFSIYNLPEFLGASSLFEGPDFNFGNSSVVISESGSNLQYHYASDGMVTTPDKLITMPECEIRFSLDEETLSELQKASSVLGVNDLALESDGSTTKLIVRDKKNASSNHFGIAVVDELSSGVPYLMNFKIENLKILPGTYTVSVSSKGISHFDLDFLGENVQYYIALEPDSKYGN